jgi:APA family basic amino acid/polyamine antiporter
LTNPQLKREIGAWGLAFNLMNIIIGAGIFVLPAVVAGKLGPASFTAYLFCGILVALAILIASLTIVYFAVLRKLRRIGKEE